MSKRGQDMHYQISLEKSPIDYVEVSRVFKETLLDVKLLRKKCRFGTFIFFVAKRRKNKAKRQTTGDLTEK